MMWSMCRHVPHAGAHLLGALLARRRRRQVLLGALVPGATTQQKPSDKQVRMQAMRRDAG
jgi:hypothetical protein